MIDWIIAGMVLGGLALGGTWLQRRSEKSDEDQQVLIDDYRAAEQIDEAAREGRIFRNPGSHEYAVTVTDPDGETSSQTIELTVTPKSLIGGAP